MICPSLVLKIINHLKSLLDLMVAKYSLEFEEEEKISLMLSNVLSFIKKLLTQWKPESETFLIWKSF